MPQRLCTLFTLHDVHGCSVLNRSPSELIQEIILVDDFSKDRESFEKQITKKCFIFMHVAHDGKLLESIPKVKLIRMDSRHGLIKARIAGTKQAIGPVLLFLDSHCEATTGWLEPLLSRIKAVSNLMQSIKLIFEKTSSFKPINALTFCHTKFVTVKYYHKHCTIH